jgi:hypothetical protein
MKELSLEKMEQIQGGAVGLWEAAGITCATAMSGLAFGGFGFFISAAIFGPSCAGLVLAAAIRD